MNTTTLRSGCKINLTLRICGRLPDGRHELDTIFFPLSEPWDELVIRPAEPCGSGEPDGPARPTGSDGPACPDGQENPGDSGEAGPGLVLDGIVFRHGRPPAEDDPARAIDLKKNTLTKAYELFSAASGFRPALRATLFKGVPSGAGLGGGSADAAALLLWLNTAAAACGRGLDQPDLTRVAAAVGADTPFFLSNTPCRGTGAGDRLSPCDPVREFGLAGHGLLLVCPAVHVSTAWAYAAFDAWAADQGRAGRSRLTAPAETAMHPYPFQGRKTQRGGVFWFENSFEAPVFHAWPELARLKARLLREGAGAAVMSGSGAAMFALFRQPDKAAAIAERLREFGMAAYCRIL